MNIYSPINSIHQVTLLDQKRSRKIDTDIDMKPSSLSSTNHCFTRMKYCDPLICSCKNCSNTKGKEVMILYNIIYSQLYDEVSNFV